jgi:hypothetical protein
MTRAMNTVVSNVQTSVITTSKPRKMKLRPITLALLGADAGAGMVGVVRLISGLDRVVKMSAGLFDKRASNRLTGSRQSRCG